MITSLYYTATRAPCPGTKMDTWKPIGIVYDMNVGVGGWGKGNLFLGNDVMQYNFV